MRNYSRQHQQLMARQMQSTPLVICVLDKFASGGTLVLQCVAVLTPPVICVLFKSASGNTVVLQCVAVCCSVLQRVAMCCSSHHLWYACSKKIPRAVLLWCSVLQCVAVCCNVLQCVAVDAICYMCALQVCLGRYSCVAVYCRVLQCIAVCCSPHHVWYVCSTNLPRAVLLCCSVLRWSVLQCVAVCCSPYRLWYAWSTSLSWAVILCCSELQHLAVCCSVLQFVAILATVVGAWHFLKESQFWTIYYLHIFKLTFLECLFSFPGGSLQTGFSFSSLYIPDHFFIFSYFVWGATAKIHFSCFHVFIHFWSFLVFINFWFLVFINF